MELKVGQHWVDGAPYPHWASIRIDVIEEDVVSYTIFGVDGSKSGTNQDSIEGVEDLMETYNYTLSKSQNFNSLYEKLCSTN